MSSYKQRKVEDSAEFGSLVTEELSKIENIELVILRGHILIEYALTRFIENYCPEEGYTLDDKFPFYQKFQVCRILGLYSGDEKDLIDQINIINKMRIQIAHKLTFDKTLLPNLYKYHKGIKDVAKKVKSGNKDLLCLTMIFAYLCGYLAARGAALITVENSIREHALNKPNTDNNISNSVQGKLSDLKIRK